MNVLKINNFIQKRKKNKKKRKRKNKRNEFNREYLNANFRTYTCFNIKNKKL